MSNEWNLDNIYEGKGGMVEGINICQMSGIYIVYIGRRALLLGCINMC